MKIKKHVIYLTWETGGARGGNCWGRGSETYTEEYEDGELENKVLTTILTDICPNISFLMYNKLEKDLLKTSEYEDRHYYGNWDDHVVKYIIFEDLVKWLIKHKIINKNDVEFNLKDPTMLRRR